MWKIQRCTPGKRLVPKLWNAALPDFFSTSSLRGVARCLAVAGGGSGGLPCLRVHLVLAISAHCQCYSLVF